MPHKTQGEIAYSLLEYTGLFKRPILEPSSPTGKLIATILDALRPGGYTFDGVELNLQVRKLDEYAVIFRRTTPVVPARSLTLGLGQALISAENLDWTEAEKFIAEQGAALNAIREVGGAEIQSQRLVVGMHIQLKDRPRKEVTAPLLSPVGLNLVDGEADFSGVILLRGKAIFTIDASLGFANGLFVRISREHPPEGGLEHLAETLRKDEEKIFDVLGLEGIL